MKTETALSDNKTREEVVNVDGCKIALRFPSQSRPEVLKALKRVLMDQGIN